MVTTLRALPADIRRRAQVIDWRRIGLASLMMLSTAVLLITLLAWQLPFGGRFVVEAGQVAPFTVVAPQALTYASDVLTLRAQERAAQAVPDQYDTDEAGVRRQQVALARTITAQIGMIRDDPDATLGALKKPRRWRSSANWGDSGIPTRFSRRSSLAACCW
jgi:hypothetical protein